MTADSGRSQAGLLTIESQPGTQPRAARDALWPTLESVCLVVAANALALRGYRLPFIGPAIGFWFIVVHPVYLLYTTSIWRRIPAAERLGYSLTGALLLLMLAGLAMNSALPLLGVRRPLDTVPVVVLADILNATLYLLRWRYPAKVPWRAVISKSEPEERRLVACSGACVVMAVLGANRLNNGAGDELSLAALGGVILTLLLLLHWGRQVRDVVTSVIVYLLSLTLLLMTSLRGWYVTGHDIQTEYRVFQLTEAHGRWDIAYFRNAYNACLSITILPTEVGRIVNVDNPYVYKVFFQLIFAACPVLVYAICRRYWSQLVAILATVYFVSFPTFFTDLPYLNRQEIAFLFVSVGILSITNAEWNVRTRRAGLFAASVGVELSHYSTMYVFLLTMVTAWGARQVVAVGRRIWLRPGRVGHARKTSAVIARTVGIGSIFVLIAIAFAWGDLATQTTTGALTDAKSAISGLAEHSGSVRSGDVSYSLLFGSTASPQVVLNQYRQQTLKQRAGSSPGTYLPLSVIDRYKTPIVSEPPSLPLTGAGHLFSDAGVPVAALNSAVRDAAAKGEQLFVGIGLIACVALTRLRRQINEEFLFLCVGSVAMVAIITVLPSLSADYGILRAFQEALILIAPVLAAGSLTVFRLLGRTWGPRAAETACIGLLASTTGLMPQLLGGYPAQLNLDNSGSYYDMYYVHPQEIAAVDWLAGKPGVLPAGLQADYIPTRFAFFAPSDVTGQQVISDIYPTVVLQSSWLILGYSTVHTGLVTTFYDGDLLTYVYPTGILQASKNLVYNNGGTEIYK